MRTLIYSYGAKLPTSNLEVIEDQLRKAHEYRHKLVECELQRRKDYNDAKNRLYPKLEELEQSILATYEKISSLRDKIKDVNQEFRQKISQPETAVKIKELEKELKTIRKERNELSKAASADDRLKNEGQAINEAANARIGVATRNCEVYSGTYLMVRDTVKRSGRPPKFHRWTGEGKIGVYIQKGLTVSEMFLGRSTHVKAERLADHAFESKTKRLHRTIVHLRVNSDDKGKPIWATIPVEFHRPLPQDAVIRWVWLLRRKRGTQYRYYLQFTINTETDRQQADKGYIGWDVGWRRLRDGDKNGLRVAYWKADDGCHGDIVIPAKRIDLMHRVEGLQSVRSNIYNDIRSKLSEWLKSGRIPDWLVEKTNTIHLWKSQSQSRLASLVIFWRTNRFDGDTEIYTLLESWRRRDKHLLLYEDNERKKLLGWRLDFYRTSIKPLAEKYKMAFIESVDWAELQKNKPPEKDENISKKYRGLASVGLFLEVVKSYFITKEVPSANTTQRCHKCKNKLSHFDKPALNHTCDHCGETWDRDYNAADNILQIGMSKEVTT